MPTEPPLKPFGNWRAKFKAKPQLQNISCFTSLAPAYDVAGTGVTIVGIDPDGPAAQQGFKTGDVILDIGGKSVANIGDVRKAIASARTQGRSAILIRVKTASATTLVGCQSAKPEQRMPRPACRGPGAISGTGQTRS